MWFECVSGEVKTPQFVDMILVSSVFVCLESSAYRYAEAFTSIFFLLCFVWLEMQQQVGDCEIAAVCRGGAFIVIHALETLLKTGNPKPTLCTSLVHVFQRQEIVTLLDLLCLSTLTYKGEEAQVHFFEFVIYWSVWYQYLYPVTANHQWNVPFETIVLAICILKIAMLLIATNSERMVLNPAGIYILPTRVQSIQTKQFVCKLCVWSG